MFFINTALFFLFPNWNTSRWWDVLWIYWHFFAINVCTWCETCADKDPNNTYLQTTLSQCFVRNHNSNFPPPALPTECSPIRYMVTYWLFVSTCSNEIASFYSFVRHGMFFVPGPRHLSAWWIVRWLLAWIIFICELLLQFRRCRQWSI